MPQAIKPATEALASITEFGDEREGAPAETPTPIVEVAKEKAPPERMRAGFEGLASEAKVAPRSRAAKQNPPSEPSSNEWVFVKNIHTGQKIKLPEGGTYQFKHSRLATTDPALARQLTAVADRYHIIVSRQPEE